MREQAPTGNNNEIVRLENACKIYQVGTEEVKALASINLTFR